ncbi:MAG: N-acetyl-gamma-glutamyl-phosphate reductase [Bacteroidota bacterium]|nr:N-acetyl-gamma-glutamyl-phosphate reductase [Bacteroidota bacterium]MDP4194736.1 N-acetyl-gamma-glutamyl-phosphate reductase [Bacteroidota bacterium]
MISVGIIGGSGYTGKKILEFCNNHPYVDNYSIYGNSTAGQSILTVFPALAGIIDDTKILSVNEISYEHDLYFIALPHGEALKYVPELIANGKKVIDLGGDYRLDFETEYEKWYKIKHSSPELLSKKFYALADYFPASSYEGVDLIANPGCYPTATLLALLPLATEFAKDILSISVSAYSGTSGAGKSPKPEMLMAEMHGNVRAYNVSKHRHQPEIFQALEKQGFGSPFSFTTHLLPVAAGIYATSSVHMKCEVTESEINEIYNNAYKDSAFVRLRNTPPDLNWVVGTNFCDINISAKGKTVIITSAIDNLIKGAAGQAVQNMNKLYNWNEKLGLLNTGVEKCISL